MERLLTTTALGLVLAVTPALAAQDTPTPDTADTQSMRDQSMNRTNVTPPDETAAKGPGLITRQDASERLASEIIGKPVYNASNDVIGEVENLLTSGDGRIAAAVISTGGFLGMGGKTIAVAYETLQFQPSETGRKITLNMSEQALKSAAPFKTPAEQKSAGAS